MVDRHCGVYPMCAAFGCACLCNLCGPAPQEDARWAHSVAATPSQEPAAFVLRDAGYPKAAALLEFLSGGLGDPRG